MSQKGFSTIVLVIIIIVLGVVGVVSYVALTREGEPFVRETPTVTPVPTPTPTPDTTASWKTFRNEEFGFEFKYPRGWSIAEINTGSGYDPSKPYILLWAGNVSDELCEGLGCPPRSGDRDELTKGFTLEGAPPLNPWFKLLRVKDKTWVSIQVTDTSINCSTIDFCNEYIAKAPLNQKQKVNDSTYKVYNDFIDLFSTFKFTN